jgi:kynureninase
MDTSLSYAQEQDAKDPLKGFRDQFHIPLHEGETCVYLCGNSLGLQPKRTAAYLQQELDDWAKYGVEGHFHAQHPWMPYHEFLTESMATIVGGLPHEVVVMNSLTVNLHLLMVSFYRPQGNRNKILIDYSPFPSDRYAVDSQVKFHGLDPKDCIIELQPEEGTEIVDTENILRIIKEHGDEIALVMIGGVNYYTGQYYDVERITKAGHAQGCLVGFDMAHGAGNVPLQLHDHGPDFAVWCTYKYLNSGPGSLAGAFVHERHAESFDLPRFAGWWGHDKDARFLMDNQFVPMRGVEGWQLSNPPILSMAAIRASLDVFMEAGFKNLVAKSRILTQYMEFLIDQLDTDRIRIITPKDLDQRGCQLSIQVKDANKEIFTAISEKGVIADWREPDVIRIATAPLYNNHEDVWRFVDILKSVI